jgi:hypothetical protein
MAFAVFPLTVAAQTPDHALLTALCDYNYVEDPTGHCKSLEMQIMRAFSISSIQVIPQ